MKINIKLGVDYGVAMDDRCVFGVISRCTARPQIDGNTPQLAIGRELPRPDPGNVVRRKRSHRHAHTVEPYPELGEVEIEVASRTAGAPPSIVRYIVYVVHRHMQKERPSIVAA